MNFHANSNPFETDNPALHTLNSQQIHFSYHNNKKRKFVNHTMNNQTTLHLINQQEGPLPAPIPASYQTHTIQPSIPINYGLQLLFLPYLSFSAVVTPIHKHLPLHTTNICCCNTITGIRDIIYQTNRVTKENPPNALQTRVLSQYFQEDELKNAAIVIQLSQTMAWNRVLPLFVLEQEKYKSQRPQLTIKAATINILTLLCYYFANDCHKMPCNRNNTTIETCKNTIKKHKMERMAKFFVHYYGRLSLGSPWELKIVEQDIVTRNYNSVVDFFNRKAKQGMFSIRYLGDVHYHNKPISADVIKGLPIHYCKIITDIYYNLEINKNKVYLLQDEQTELSIPTTASSVHQGSPDAIMLEYEEYYRDATAEVERCFNEHNQLSTELPQTLNATEDSPLHNKTPV